MWDDLVHKYLHLPYNLHIYSDKKIAHPKATVLLLHGMGNSGKAWDELIAALPDSVRVISIDLLGFGSSPSPRWLKYNSTVQARSVIATLLRARIRQPLILVGHSMGSLVAVEIAKRYPALVKSLVLCSPPLYTEAEKQALPDQQKILRDFYSFALKNPQKIVGAVPLATKLKIVGKAFNVTNDNVAIYMAVLESSIMSQSALSDAAYIKKPIHIIYGAFDPLIVKRNLTNLAKQNSHVIISSVLSGHEINEPYIPVLLAAIGI